MAKNVVRNMLLAMREAEHAGAFRKEAMDEFRALTQEEQSEFLIYLALLTLPAAVKRLDELMEEEARRDG